MAIRAIETRYAGFRFRSRLEARWAVFFDTIGITWQYEAQGFQLVDRLGVIVEDSRPINYLPDFWLPEFNLHAEVKGSLTDYELRRTLTAAAALSSPSGGCGGGHDSVILGPIPEPDGRSRLPYRLHMHKGDLIAVPFWACPVDSVNTTCPARWPRGGGIVKSIAADTGEIRITGDALLSGHYDDKVAYRFLHGYRAARGARFEHGEQG